MARSIITHAEVRAAARNEVLVLDRDVSLSGEPTTQVKEAEADDYGTRLLKYIPAEVVAVYVFIQGILSQAGSPGPNPVLLWIVFGLIFVLTPVYLIRVQKVTKVVQLTICTIAFAIWVFSLGGPFALYSWYQPLYGAVLLPLFTFTAGIVEPAK